MKALLALSPPEELSAPLHARVAAHLRKLPAYQATDPDTRQATDLTDDELRQGSTGIRTALGGYCLDIADELDKRAGPEATPFQGNQQNPTTMATNAREATPARSRQQTHEPPPRLTAAGRRRPDPRLVPIRAIGLGHDQYPASNCLRHRSEQRLRRFRGASLRRYRCPRHRQRAPRRAAEEPVRRVR